MKRKATLGIVALLLLTGGYYLSKPIGSVENMPARDISCKVYPLRGDSVVLLIPYRVTVHNNRWKPLDLRLISDANRNKIHPDNLLYNVRGTELGNYYDPRYKDLHDHYFAQKYRHTVFPFWSRTFYYYRPYAIAKKELKLSLTAYTQEQVRVQLMDLHENFPLAVPASVLDSLYAKDRGHRFVLHFGGGALAPVMEAMTDSSEQKLILLQDSVRDMNVDEAKAWLRDYFGRSASEEKML